MNIKKKDTALLVFSLSAEQEIRRKTIFGKNYKNEERTFFNLLIKQTERLASESGIDVFWVDEHRQRGIDFSTRFTNAFQNLFDAGYENVVSIGNDCADLTIQVLQGAIKKLQKRRLVLGPSKDGGVYLLGMNKTVFDRRAFLKLPWQTTSLCIGLQKYANSRNLAFDLLATFSDLDSAKDVVKYSKSNSSTLLSRFFKAIIESIKFTFEILNDFIPSDFKYSYVGLRAPPKV